MVRERLAQPDTLDGFVLDGFPRTVEQAVALDKLISARGPLVVIAFDLNTEVLVQRLASRGRADDTQRIIRERLRVYERDTEPVLDYYRHRGLMTVLDGDRSPEAVSEAIEAVVTRSLQSRKIA